jgi:hypothetical protein
VRFTRKEGLLFVERDREREVLDRYGLVVVGPVVERRGVEARADAAEPAPHRLLAGECRGALELQVFEKVRRARVARRLVARTDLVVDDERRDRRGVVLLEQHLQAIRQRGLAHVAIGHIGDDARTRRSRSSGRFRRLRRGGSTAGEHERKGKAIHDGLQGKQARVF